MDLYSSRIPQVAEYPHMKYLVRVSGFSCQQALMRLFMECVDVLFLFCGRVVWLSVLVPPPAPVL